MQDKVSVRNVLRLSGVFLTGGIGCGFATGQEVMQFFTSEGIWSLFGILISTIIFSWMGALFMRHGYERTLNNPIKTFDYYYGHRLGRIIELVVQFFTFGAFVIMVSGGGAVLYQCFNFPQLAGRTILIVLGFLTVSLGLTHFLNLISFIGTALALLTVVVGLMCFIPKADTLMLMAKECQTLEITKTNAPWFISSVLYPSFNSLAIVIMATRAGCEANNSKEASLGGLLGGLLFGLAIFSQNIGLLANITDVYNADIPTVALVGTINPILSKVLAITIFIGIYSAGIPMLWGLGAHFAKDKTKHFTIIVFIISLLAFFLGNASDFKSLINTIYPVTGYIALSLLFLLGYRDYHSPGSLLKTFPIFH